MSWLQAFILVAAITCTLVVAAGAMVTWTDPGIFPTFGTGLWWAVATITTVGYGDLVPVSPAGRLVGAALMFAGIGSIAFLTAIAASAIVVGEVAEEEREIQREEQEIQREEREIEQVQAAIFARLAEIDARLARMENGRPLGAEVGAEPAAAADQPLVPPAVSPDTR